MNCRHCRETILDMVRGVAAADARADARAHLRVCAPCARYLQQEQSLTAGLRALAAADQVPSQALEARLIGALESAAGGQEGGPAAFPSANRQPLTAFRRWLPVAAALLLAGSVMGWWQAARSSAPASSPDAVRTETAQTPATQPPNLQRTPGSRASGEARARDGVASGSARRGGETILPPSPALSRPLTRAASARIVRATGFVALPGADTLPPFEHGEIVRVRVPMASLANLGFNVQPDAADTAPIDADLLVGQDGQPRAIRLVTNDSQETNWSR